MPILYQAANYTPYGSLHGIDFAALFLRLALGVVMLAHGYNHMWGGGKLEGTGRWFESIGIKPGWLHARLATYTELGVETGLLGALVFIAWSLVLLRALLSRHVWLGAAFTAVLLLGLQTDIIGVPWVAVAVWALVAAAGLDGLPAADPEPAPD